MRYDIIALGGSYLGIENCVGAMNYLSKQARKNYDKLFELYLNYLSNMELPFNQENFKKILTFYKALQASNVPCIVIAYDNKPLSDCYGYSIQFMGIDIVRDLCESMLSDTDFADRMISFLNQNGLCQDISFVKKILSFADTDLKWEPCWVYQVLC